MINSRPTLFDCLFLLAIQSILIALYVSSLGFYSDDWGFLATYTTSQDQSIIGLFKSVYVAQPWAQVRPVQLLYLSILYWLYGLNPLGHHITNACVLTVAVLLFYLIIREVGGSRLFALAVPLVYSLLPHYSTDRFWYAAFQVNLSVALYFLNLCANLKATQPSQGLRRFPWAIVSIISLLGSALAYEMVLPLFVFSVAITWYKARQAGTVRRMTTVFLLAANLIALPALIMFKYLKNDRISHNRGFFEQLLHYNYAKNIIEGLKVHFGSYGFALPVKIFRILRDYPDPRIVLLGVLLGAVVFAYLYHLTKNSRFTNSSRVSAVIGMALGLLLFGLGYAAYLPVGDISFSTTGISNRTAAAASIGVAVFFVAAITFFISLWPSTQLSRLIFCLLLSLLCATGYIINNTVANFWAAAYKKQQEVLTEVIARFPTLPEGTHLILDGVCPYVGPAIVFDSQWDLAEALRLRYRNDTIDADIVRPSLVVGEAGLTTSSYEVYKRHHSYGKNLLLYHFGQKMAYKLTDASTARLYFEKNRNACPEGSEGYGVRVF